MGAPPGEPYFADEPPEDEFEDNVTTLSYAAIYRNALVDSVGLDTIPEPIPLITATLFTDSTAWIVGKPGHGKSFVALDIAGCVGTGEAWQDRGVTQGLVLYVAAEGVSGMKRRVRAWEQSYGRKMTGVIWLPMAVQAGKPAEWRGLRELAADLKPAMIVLDTQARVTVGMEENAAKDMGEFIDALEKLRQATAACVLTVHHQGRSGDHMRGSTAMDGAATTVIRVEKDEDVITVKNPKQKDVDEFEDIELKLTPCGPSAVLTLTDGKTAGSATAATKTAQRWYETFQTDKVTATKLIDAELTTKATFYRHVRILIDQGAVMKEEAGRATYYSLTRVPVS
ncbi:AAA family ATPase [Kribbella catacumbae]|uniref:AAA family ATPase n=1 Tax=Kribbella catacumbae TaxID=460086 RepID=UPI000369892A|nr:AAA family ATPase [Kribbella catacumbae]